MDFKKQRSKGQIVSGGGGLGLYVEETGNPNGIPLLFIHGFNQCRLAWKKQTVSDLADNFRIITVDNPGSWFIGKAARRLQ